MHYLSAWFNIMYTFVCIITAAILLLTDAIDNVIDPAIAFSFLAAIIYSSYLLIVSLSSAFGSYKIPDYQSEIHFYVGLFGSILFPALFFVSILDTEIVLTPFLFYSFMLIEFGFITCATSTIEE